jgi:hypothetical protein
MRRDHTGDRSGSSRRSKRYLPSEQVIKELVTLGPDLGTLADELRNRLSEPTVDAGP